MLMFCRSPLNPIAATLAAIAASLYWTGSAAVSPPAEGDPALARDILRELIEIRSTHANGTTGAAKAVLARLTAAGFAPADAQLLIPAEYPLSGNVVARL